MRRHAKASSARPTLASATTFGSFRRAAPPMNRRCLGFLLGGLSAFLLLASAPLAQAAPKQIVAATGKKGTGAGEFAIPTGVAINQTSGDVYVYDDASIGDPILSNSNGGGQRVEQFTAGGEFIRAWGWGVATGAPAFEICTLACRGGIAGSGNGQFSSDYNAPERPYISIDQSDGSVYVVDTGNHRVQKFSASGVYLEQFGIEGTGNGEFQRPQGIAVDPVSKDVYVVDTDNNRIQRFDSDGDYLSQIGTLSGGSEASEFINPRGVAVDSIGRLYVLDDGNARVQRFTAAGAFDEFFAEGLFNGGEQLAVDPADNHVYLAAANSDFTVRGILEFAPDGSLAEIHATRAEQFFPGGLAVRSSTGRIYASSNESRLFILDEVTTPTVSIEPATDIDDEGATFHGTVNPQGGPPSTGYHFEYSADGGASWTKASRDDVSVGEGTAGVAVSHVATDLEANTEYRLRLVATKEFGSGAANSSEVTFTTSPGAPFVHPLDPGAVTPTSARLGARVNPRNSSSTYYLEYATDPGYSGSTKLPVSEDAPLGSGNADVFAVQRASDLQPGTTYHYRVVATNVAGTTKGADRTFETLPAVSTSPARAYEMVSPLDKNGGEPERDLSTNGFALSATAASGEAVVYGSELSFGNAESSAAFNLYRSSRNENGWATQPINPPYESDPAFPAIFPVPGEFSDDLSRMTWRTNSVLVPEADLLGGSWGLYRQDDLGTTSTYRLLSVPSTPLPSDDFEHAGGRFFAIAATPDMDQVVFEVAGRQLTSEGPAGEDTVGIYVWRNGSVQFVSELPSGLPASESSAGGGGGRAGQYYPGDHLISDDGRRIYFNTGEPATRGPAPLYVRDDAGTQSDFSDDFTLPVSASERTGDNPAVAHPSTFQAAKASDGSLALFTSGVRLTDDAKSEPGNCVPGDLPISECHDDLFLWDANAPADERLTDLTTADPEGGGVSGIAAAAEDLSKVYFVAGGDLAPGAVDGSPNLYLWSSGDDLRHIATLDHGDTSVWSYFRGNSNLRYRDARVSADGNTLLFVSRARLTAYDTAGTKQVYRYDAGANELTCVSCSDLTESSPSAAWLYFSQATEGTMPSELPRNLSADGRSVFFETSQQLIPSDVNGAVDVYEWLDGELSLISSGAGSGDAKLIGASLTGRDAFFTTRDRLVGRDTDNQLDVYDARLGGGFPESQAPTPCTGDACRGPLAPIPPAASPGTATFSGPGNPTGKQRCAKGKTRRGGRCVARKPRKHQKKNAKRNRASDNRRASR